MNGGYPPPVSAEVFYVQRRGLSAEMIMSKQNNGGPAFPHSAKLVAPDTYEHLTNGGMSLRDYFAAKAMAAIVRRWDGHSFGGGPDSPQYKELAEDAYHIADAMLRARESS